MPQSGDVPQSGPTLLQEALAAARGMLALVIGDRRAPDNFDFTLRGLAGAGIVFLGIVALTHYGPLLAGVELRAGIGRSALLLVGIMAAQIGAGVALLSFLRRSDAIVPFITATLWASVFVSLASFFGAFTGLPASAVVTVFGLLLLVVEVNIGRLIVTLPPLQVGGLVAAQLMGSFIGLTIAGSFMPLPSDVASTLGAPALQ